MPRCFKVRSHFSGRLFFWRSWHAHFHCAQPPDASRKYEQPSQQPSRRLQETAAADQRPVGNNNRHSRSNASSCHTLEYQIVLWYLRTGAKFSPHQFRHPKFRTFLISPSPAMRQPLPQRYTPRMSSQCVAGQSCSRVSRNGGIRFFLLVPERRETRFAERRSTAGGYGSSPAVDGWPLAFGGGHPCAVSVPNAIWGRNDFFEVGKVGRCSRRHTIYG